MNLSNETYERIERYLLQEMTPEEAQNFEADCQANPELAAALAQEKKIHLLIRIHNQSRVRKQIRTLDQSAARPKVIPFARMRRVTLLIGTIAAIFLVAIGFWWNGMGDNGASLSDEFAPPLLAMIKPKPRGLEELNLLEGFYQEGDWDSVIVCYARLPDTLKADLEIKVLTARAYYEKKEYPLAGSLASAAMGEPSSAKSEWRCKAKLLMVFIHLQQGRLSDASALIDIKSNLSTTWACLGKEKHEPLRKMHRRLEKILP